MAMAPAVVSHLLPRIPPSPGENDSGGGTRGMRRAVEPEKLRILFEAARWAASCFNEQPWRFIVATKENPAEYEKLLGCLVEKNQKWATSAPVLMISVAQLNFAHNGKPNRHALHD